MLIEIPDSGKLSLAPAEVTVADATQSASTPATTEGGGVVGVVDWAAASYVESGLEAVGKTITIYVLVYCFK